MPAIVYGQKDIRRAYHAESSVLDSTTLRRMFAGGEANVELVAYIAGKIKVSDRPKYVGNFFYQGRAELPKIERKMPPLLSAQLSFSELEVTVNNCDGFYNDYLIGGELYDPFVGAPASLSVGLRDVVSTYFDIFNGIIHTEGGLERSRDKITFRAREFFEYFNTKVPFPMITVDEFEDAPKDVLGKMIPFCVGDWSYGVEFTDSAITVNVDVAGDSVAVKTKETTEIGGGTSAYYVGGEYFLIGIGQAGGYALECQTIEDCVIKRGDNFLKVDFQSAPAITPNGYWAVRVGGLIRASDGATIAYNYSQGDVAVVRTKISSFGSAAFEDVDSNPIILTRLFLFACAQALNLTFDWDLDFSSNWDVLANKETPSQSNMKNGIKARIWIGDDKTNVLEYAIGLLRQVRCDLFVNKQRQIDIASQHFEDVPQPDTLRHIEQVHVLEDTINPRLDRQNIMTSANATYSFVPVLSGASRQIVKYQNAKAKNALGAETAKTFELPNLYREADVLAQLVELLRFYSALTEEITLSTCWVHLDAELGEWVTLSLNVGSLQFDRMQLVEDPYNPGNFYTALNRVVCQIRSISVDPSGGSLEMKLLSLGNFKVPNYTPPNDDLNLSSYDRLIETG